MSRQTRRAFLAALGATSLAGCSTSLRGPGGSEPGTTTTDAGTTTTRSGTGPETTSTTATTTTTAEDESVQFEGFEAPERWYALTQQGSINTTTADAAEGSTSLHVTADGDVAGAFKAFSAPKDFSGKTVSVALKVHSPADVKFQVQLLAPDRGNKAVMTRTLPGPTDTWQRVDMGVTREVRDPDLASVQEVRLLARRHGESDEPVEFLVDDVRLLDRPDHGYAMLTFDDVMRSHYTTALPAMKEFGFAGVEGVVSDAVYGEDRLDVGMMRKMRDEGWDMASRPPAPRPLTDYSADAQRQRIERNKQFLERKGFREGARHFVTPGRRRGPETMDVVSDLHDTMFTFGGMPNGLPSTTTYNYSRINAANTPAVRDLVDLTAAYDGLLVCRFTDVGTGRAGAMSEADFRAVLQYLDQSELEVVTASDLLEMQG